jgi:hypothetical protein
MGHVVASAPPDRLAPVTKIPVILAASTMPLIPCAKRR